MKPIASKSVVQSFALVKSSQAPLSPVEKKRLGCELQLTANDLLYCGSPVPWGGTMLLKNLVEIGRSCLIFGSKGSGMGSAVAWLAGEPTDGFAAVVPTDLSDCYRQLWLEMGQPTKGIQGACQVCPRQQKVCSKGIPYFPDSKKQQPDGEVVRKWKPNFSISPWGKDPCEIQEFVNWDRECLFPKIYLLKALGLGDVITLGEKLLDKSPHAAAKKDKVIRDKVISVAVESSQMDKYDVDLAKMVVIRLPEVGGSAAIGELNKLLCAILDSGRALIILADTEQEKHLTGPGLGKLHRIPWPKPDGKMLAEMLKARMQEAEIHSLPFSTKTLSTIALLADFRPGPFLEILENSLLSAEGLVQPSDILGMGNLTDEAVVSLALASYKPGQWFAISELADVIYEKFRRDITPDKLGRCLRHLSLEYRRGDEREYRLPVDKDKLLP